MRGSLGSQSARDVLVSEVGDLLGALLDNDEVQSRDVVADNATADGLSLALTSTTRAEASGACQYER